MSVDLHTPPGRRRRTGPGGNTRTTPLPLSRVLTLLMHFSPCVRLANHHAIASMMYPTRRGKYPKAREEYSIEGGKPGEAVSSRFFTLRNDAHHDGQSGCTKSAHRDSGSVSGGKR